MIKKIETVLYVRLAIHSEINLHIQRTQGEKFADINGLTISIIEDIGSSREPLSERAGFKWLMHLIEVGLVKTVIVDTHCRISRNPVDIFDFYSFLEKHNANLIVISEV